MLKAILFKSVATMHNGMSKFKSPMIRNQNWVYLLQYCHDSNAPSIKMARFTFVGIVADLCWKRFCSNRSLQCITACPSLSPQWSGIKTEYISCSIARFECAKHQNGPFHPCRYCGYLCGKRFCFKSVATMHNGMSKFKSPMIRNQNWVYLLQYCDDSNAPSIKIARFTFVRYCGYLCWKRFCSNQSLQCITACPSLSPQWSGIKTEYISCSIATIRMRQASKWPVSLVGIVVIYVESDSVQMSLQCITACPSLSPQWSGIKTEYISCKRSVESDSDQIATMHNGMSKFKSPMIRNQKLSISLAVLPRFECAKHQNGPFQPCQYCGDLCGKRFCSNRSLQCITACPSLSPQWSGIKIWVYLLQYCHDSNAPSIKMARFTLCRYCGDLCWKRFCSNRSLQCITACPSLSPQWSGIKTEYISCSIATIRMRQASKWPVSTFVGIVAIYVESDSVQIGRYNA